MKSTDEVNCLKLAADSLKEELEREKEELETVRQREGMASVAVASVEAEVNRTKSDVALAQMREKEAREKMMELPKQLQVAVKNPSGKFAVTVVYMWNGSTATAIED